MRCEHAKQIVAIRFKPDGSFVAFGAKCGWAKPAFAKNAFKLHMGFYLDECPDYEVVDLTEAYYRLEGLDK